MIPSEPDARLEHYRGPGRGDGHRSRSLAWWEQRRIALTRECPYVLVVPAPSAARDQRGQRMECGAGVGEPCRDPRTGDELTKLAAHIVRIFPRYVPEETNP